MTTIASVKDMLWETWCCMTSHMALHAIESCKQTIQSFRLELSAACWKYTMQKQDLYGRLSSLYLKHNGWSCGRLLL